MGVPGFFAYLYRNHSKSSDIIIRKKNIIDKYFSTKHDLLSINNLYIDANCLIHPQAAKMCEEYKHLINDEQIYIFEQKIISSCIKYISKLIEETKPTDLIYIAVDGVAPMAKIKHQRQRRFKYMYDIDNINEIKKKYNIEIENKWNTSAITPGTIFMTKLTKSIINWINQKDYNIKKIIFSSCYTPGEGEHKILQYMKNNNNINDVNIVYGLDADLIFLALSSQINKIYLLRETTEIETKKENLTNLDEFSYINIDVLKNIIFIEMTKYMDNIEKIKENMMEKKIINDFIFLCYLCGNDFLPNIPSLSIGNIPNTKNGLQLIFETYSIIQKNIYETSNILQYILDITEYNKDRKMINFNNDMLIQIFEILSNYEETYFNTLYNYKKNTFVENEKNYKNEIYNYENLNYYIEDNIQLGNSNIKYEEYKKNYYSNYYNIDIDKYYIHYQLKSYISGLVWTSYYYFDKCVDWFYYYKYHHGPFISDILGYLKMNKNIFNNISKHYVGEEYYINKIKPLHQLLMVLPKKSINLLPASLKTLFFSKKLIKYFPDEIKKDDLYKYKSWQSILMIETIEPEIIINMCNKIILNDSDKSRNNNYLPFIK